MKFIKQSILLTLFMLFGQLIGAQSSLTGTIKNSKGEILPLAVVQLEGENLAVASDVNGVFTLNNLGNGNHTLKVTFLGYQPESKRVALENNRVTVDFSLAQKDNLQDEVTVIGSRASAKDPIAFTNITAEQLKPLDGVQDIPYLLSMTPSVVVSSDAGNGVGYTSIKVRGTDGNRINVTMDGIPMNDAESHGVWWVNMPDVASSTGSFQIQRGVGTSSQGSGAFGASINMQSEKLNKDAYSQVAASYGSFNTSKLTAKVGTGLLNDHFTFDARLSKIGSDGFVDRASSNLKSFYLSGGYYGKTTTVKLDIFSGQEKTYQSWYGVPSVKLNNDTVGMQRYLDHGLYTTGQLQSLLSSDSRTYNYYTYDNQTDNYAQDHYHLTLNQVVADKLTLKLAGHYTYGRGYYESGKTNPDTISIINQVNQKWLNNDFYGALFSLNYTSDKLALTFGGGINQYDGRHHGIIVFDRSLPANQPKDFEWYRSTGKKLDLNVYTRLNYQLLEMVNLFADLQYRHIGHKINGIDEKLRNISQYHIYNFFNPKFGVNITLNEQSRAFASFSIANREPNRSNFVDANPAVGAPRPERLFDYELGYQYTSTKLFGAITGYYMDYKDQLVMTGAINDVGSAIMTNVDKSYRMGIEIQGAYKLGLVDVAANATFSKNKIAKLFDHVDNWDVYGTQIVFERKDVDIAFSPKIIANGIITVNAAPKLKVNFISQYVDHQFLDNTQSNERDISSYFIENMSVNYGFVPKFCKSIDLSLFANNILNRKYVSNGWVYSYMYGGTRYAQDGLFPQAGTNFMASVTFNF